MLLVKYLAKPLLPLLLLLLCLPAVATAVDTAGNAPIGVSREMGSEITGIKAGPFLLHPYLNLRETYSDNIYLTTDNRKGDFITTIMPGIQVELPFKRNLLSFGGSAIINEYAKYSSENTIDWNANTSLDLNLGSRFKLKLSDNFLDSHEPRSESSTITIEKYKNNSALASLTYMLADVSKIQLDYTNAYWKYKTSDFRSRDENQGSFYLYYRILQKTSIFGEYDFKQVSFTNNTQGLDNNVQTAQVGLTWELSSRSKGTVKAGYLLKSFDQQLSSNINTFIASIDGTHYFSDNNWVKLTGARTVNESSFMNAPYSITTGIYGEFTHRFLERLSSTLKFSYGNERYSNIVPGELVLRVDKVVQAGAAIQYAFRRWLDCTLEYYWRNKDSTISIYNSSENNVSLGLTFHF